MNRPFIRNENMPKLLTSLALVLFLTGCMATYGGKDPVSKEGQLIRYSYSYENQKINNTDAVYRKPTTNASGKSPAVIILHDGGGWSTERTRQYGDLFTANGYATLEPRLFNDDKAPRTYKKDLASLYAALEYLATQPNIDQQQIYALGMSAGAILTMLAKTQAAKDTFGKTGPSFKALASFYPVCWIFSDVIDGKTIRIFKDFSANDLKSWQPTPIKLFIPEFDDYEDKDSTTCANFIAKIPNKQASDSFSIKMYSGATHGWDHGKTYSFQTGAGCKGKGCINTNQSNPGVTASGYKDVLDFFNGVK
jgi:dienelactone hydrolase